MSNRQSVLADRKRQGIRTLAEGVVPEDAKAALVKPDGLVHLIPGIDGLVAFGTDILLLCNSDGVCEDKPVVLVVLDGRHGRAQGVGVVRSERAAQNSAVSIPRLES